MSTISRWLPALMFSVFLVTPAWAQRTLRVGPGAKFNRLSQAIRVARNGDTIEINSRGNYAGDVCSIPQSRLTIRGTGKSRAVFPAAGKNSGGKAIWVIRGANVTVENIEFRGCRVRDRNGAGIRAEGRNLTVRNCKFFDCENGILGGAGTMLVEHCEFSHCGLNGRAHNLYIGSIDKLIFRFNYSHHAKVGHLLKSRAKQNLIAYNYLTDDRDGTSSYIANFPNGGRTVLLGNILVQSPRTNNSSLVAYGEEGVKHAGSALYVVHNTLVNNRRTGTFLQVKKVRPKFEMIVRNNIFAGRGTISNRKPTHSAANLAGKRPLFLNPAKFDFGLQPNSPAVGAGIEAGKAGELSLTPRFQYAHPHEKRLRAAKKRPDLGAFSAGK